MALHESFGSIVAEVAEVSVNGSDVRVHKVWCAIDCGFAVHPEGVKAQMESAINYGLTAALYGEITFTDGKVDQSNFHDYQILRVNEAPEIDVTIVNSGEQMGGAGEPGTPPIAPAVTNAIYAATGKRIRKLPITKEPGLSSATVSVRHQIVGSHGRERAHGDRDRGLVQVELGRMVGRRGDRAACPSA